MLSENKSVRERQIPYDFTYTWSLKNNINKQTKLKIQITERELVVARGEEGLGC